jgi:hypothetical protein
MKETSTIAFGVFIGLLLFTIFLWIIGSIIWLIYGKRYFVPSRQCHETCFIPYFTTAPEKKEIMIDLSSCENL